MSATNDRRLSSKEAKQLAEISQQLEKRLHFGVIRFLFEAGTKLRMTSVPLATAATLYHRFFQHFTTNDFDPYMIATTAIYLASKIEEEQLRLTDVINVSYRILHHDKPPIDIGATYWALRDSIVQCELFVARALRFQFSVSHPHKFLVHYLKSLLDWLDRRTVARVPIASTCWALLNDSYLGSLCLSHQPDITAAAVIHMALQCYGIIVPPQESNNAKYEWWEALVDDVQWSDIKHVISDILDIYELESLATTVTTTH